MPPLLPDHENFLQATLYYEKVRTHEAHVFNMHPCQASSKSARRVL